MERSTEGHRKGHMKGQIKEHIEKDRHMEMIYARSRIIHRGDIHIFARDTQWR